MHQVRFAWNLTIGISYSSNITYIFAKTNCFETPSTQEPSVTQFCDLQCTCTLISIFFILIVKLACVAVMLLVHKTQKVYWGILVLGEYHLAWINWKSLSFSRTYFDIIYHYSSNCVCAANSNAACDSTADRCARQVLLYVTCVLHFNFQIFLPLQWRLHVWQ